MIKPVKIGNRYLSTNSNCYIIAEIGNNHQGNIDMAKELVDKCIEANVDCIKFQMRTMSSLYENQGNGRKDLLAKVTGSSQQCVVVSAKTYLKHTSLD